MAVSSGDSILRNDPVAIGVPLDRIRPREPILTETLEGECATRRGGVGVALALEPAARYFPHAG